MHPYVQKKLNCNYHFCFYKFPGKIVANQTVDFEQVQWLNFTIRAQDHGSPPRIAELPVYLRIVDVNDNNPVFLQPAYQVLNRMSVIIARRLMS